ncbi:MAG: AbrB/MazE/SpoVT family DNA-binding domain-containing protein [Candidatus Nanohaloarchaea archaeon]
MSTVAEVGKIGTRGQVTIPKEVREDEDLEPGDHVVIWKENSRLVIEKLDLNKWKETVEEVREDYEGPTSAEEIAEMIDD